MRMMIAKTVFWMGLLVLPIGNSSLNLTAGSGGLPPGELQQGTDSIYLMAGSGGLPPNGLRGTAYAAS